MSLLREVTTFYAAYGRKHLPWRKTKDPYKIWVSEVMLQQTQVDRVLPKYKDFIQTFPTPAALAKASFAQVLARWSGLGYNRRAKFLHDAAAVIVAEHKGVVPKDVAALEKLPGVGPYTARAVAAFAYNQPVVFIETNIRTVFTYFYCADKKDIPDTALLPLIQKDLHRSKMEPRDFYAALMDYGAHLKRSGVRLNAKSKHHTKQSVFEGSTRQLRGNILRQLLSAPKSSFEISRLSGRKKADVSRELQKLCREGLIVQKGSIFAVA